MIQRVVLIELDDAYSGDAERRQIAAHSREVLAGCPQVRELRVATPADRRAEQWDLCILVQLDDLDAVEAYRVDPTHRAYVDVFLKPMLRKIRVWNFELSEDGD